MAKQKDGEVVDFDKLGHWEEEPKDHEVPRAAEKVKEKKKAKAKVKASAKQAAQRKKEGGALTGWGIDKQVKKDFRQACDDNGLTMKEALSSLMCEFISVTYSRCQE